ncbi:TetR/AcrR family transcriptional regulator [Falsibacillus albus]|uniref:TetR/AcrR family transcriptional regulator n=1 Tax=Falsibacillus albus TaxID=2478915 RepID=A0A3L7JTE3_9BACI|nr:TetR/AcrR family transcriptional regulator [Falsibacillus albus]
MGGVSKLLFKSLNIDPEKEDRIVNAALKVFSQNGYQKASTNAIVKEAKISKGLLFHYFKSKKDLYLSLSEQLSDLFLEKIYERVDWEESDIFCVLRQIVLLKFELFKVYPEMTDFLNAVYQETDSEVAGEINRKKEKLIAESFRKLFANIDVNKFKESVDVQKSIKIIHWTFEGMGRRNQERYKEVPVDQLDKEEILSEIDAYIHILKQSFYK